MNAKQWTIVAASICCLPLVIVIGVIMTLCGKDPFAELKRITREG